MSPQSLNVNAFADIKPADFQRLAKVEHYLVETGSSCEPDLERLAGRVLLSAIVFGGLLNRDAWSAWFKALLACKWQASHQALYFELEAGIYRDWYPDPITGCIRALFYAQLKSTSVLPNPWSQPEQLIASALGALAVSVPREQALKTVANAGPEWLVRACRARLHQRILPLLADHAAGLVTTHRNTTERSKNDEKVERLAKVIAAMKPRTAWQPRCSDGSLYHLWEAFFPNDPQVVANSGKLAQSMRDALDWQIANWQRPANAQSVHLHLLTWLRTRLETKQKNSAQYLRPIRPSTARNFLASLASYNWSRIRKTSIKSRVAPERLAKAFADLSCLAEECRPREAETLLVAVASFSQYLHSLNEAIAPCSAPQSVRKPPRTTVLDGALFTELLFLLRQWGKSTADPSEPDRLVRSKKCVFAAILMFRTGLRGSEVLNLALNDIVFAADAAELTVRGSVKRPNKTSFSRRTLPLHVLLAPEELAAVRRWHAGRCDEKFHADPRANLIAVEQTEGLSAEQYILDAIHAAIHVLVGQSAVSHPEPEEDYYYAPASPLRHSFATHLVTCLLLPDEDDNFPRPAGWTKDVVSPERKKRLKDAFLPAGHVGLSVMQVVRYLLGHASYTQSLTTYIHNIDWLLAAYLWRRLNQLKTSQLERDAYFIHLPKTARKEKTARSPRQLLRVRNIMTEQSALPTGALLEKRGRKGKNTTPWLRRSNEYDDYISVYLELNVFSLPPRKPKALQHPAARPPALPPPPARFWHMIDVPPRDWRAVHNFLEKQRRGISVEDAAEQLALPLEDCRRWSERAQFLASIQTRSS